MGRTGKRAPLIIALTFACLLIPSATVLAVGGKPRHRTSHHLVQACRARHASRIRFHGKRRGRRCAPVAHTSRHIKDTSSPTAPANLAATAGDRQVTLSWTASSDNVAVVGYYVYRNGAKVAQTSGRTYTDTGLTDGVAYSYDLVAYDQAGNLSAASSTVSATPIDTTPPQPVSGLTATAGNAQVSLSWTASSDNVGVVGYAVYRNGVRVGQSSGTSFTDTGLTDGTAYSYDVTAYDLAGNVSAPSNSVSATPLAAASAATPCLPWLQAASGTNMVVAGTNQPVLLHGANIMEAEWRNNLNWENAAIPALASSAWNGRVVVHGFASDPVNSNDASYLSLLDGYVSLTKANHMYLILAWRSDAQNGAQPSYPDAGAQSALATLAARYKGDAHVMFALQVEPHDVAWSTVRPIYEQMIDAIRQAAAPGDPPNEPVIFAPGVAWGKDISGAITDPVKRSNIVYKSHPYTSSANFQQYFGSAYDAGLPVFIGEFGPTQYMSMSDINSLMSYTSQRNIGWAAWGYEYDATPNVVDSSLNPTSPFGTTVQSNMINTPPIPGC